MQTRTELDRHGGQNGGQNGQTQDYRRLGIADRPQVCPQISFLSITLCLSATPRKNGGMLRLNVFDKYQKKLTPKELFFYGK